MTDDKRSLAQRAADAGNLDLLALEVRRARAVMSMLQVESELVGAAAIMLGLPDHAERFADIGRRRRSAMARFEAASTALTQALRSPKQ